MAKKIGIITMAQEAGAHYEMQIKEVFGDEVEVLLYSIEGGTADSVRRADLYIVSMSAIESCVELDLDLPFGVFVLDIEVDFTVEHVRSLRSLPKGTKALMVNGTEFLVTESITRLQQLGVHNVDFYPAYPGLAKIPQLPLAVTPGEAGLVPEGVETVINLGHRKIAPQMMAEIALELDLRDIFEKKSFVQYLEQFDLGSYCNLHSSLTKSLYIGDCFEAFVESMDEGIVGADVNGDIFCFNRKAGEILECGCEKMTGKNIRDELDFLPFAQCKATLLPVENAVKKLGEGYINYSVTPILRKERFRGIFVTIQRFTEAERKQQEARMQVLNKGHVAKYYFENIVGASEAIHSTKELAGRMAKTDFTILIYGESGTGKELFASAIHNDSSRSAYPFIAINCAAMPETLLESELFGYEEGAFTGAKKGGHLGFFEFAHKGTLFLDEIENMSPSLQVKLLRVLQEREVMRVGGYKTISVDVRIIAATNENLELAVRKGTFRKDLYYRLSTLPIEIPRLNQRREDVLLLFDYFRSRYGKDFQLDEDVKQTLVNHDWDGNVRELQNYFEYFICLDRRQITMEDLPQSLRCNGAKGVGPKEVQPGEIRLGEVRSEENGSQTSAAIGSPAIGTSVIGTTIGTSVIGTAVGRREEMLQQAAGKRLFQYQFVLSALYDGHVTRSNVGRNTLVQKAEEQDLFLTEQEARTILNRLQDLDLVCVCRGRGGSRLTREGKELAEHFRQS